MKEEILELNQNIDNLLKESQIIPTDKFINMMKFQWIQVHNILCKQGKETIKL